MQVYRLEVLALVALLTAAGAANLGCGSSSSSSSSGSTSSTSTSGGGSGGSGTTGSTTTQSSGAGPATESSTSMSSSGSGGSAVYGYCSKPCTAASACCPAGAKDCPSAQYPNNYTCVSGACVNPACSGTLDCIKVNPKLDCFTNEGIRDCAFACATDGDCTAPQTCVGMDDNGKKYCVAKGGGCTEAMCVSLGLGTCVNGVCSCKADTDCTRDGFTKCVK